MTDLERLITQANLKNWPERQLSSEAKMTLRRAPSTSCAMVTKRSWHG